MLPKHEHFATIDGAERVFIVWSNTDLTEGRGREYPRNVCERLTTAHRLSKGCYIMGTDAHVTEDFAYMINGKRYVLGDIVRPNSSDLEIDREREAERIAREKFDAVVERFKELGITDEDLDVLMKNAPKA
jgi:hypothetical protein